MTSAIASQVTIARAPGCIGALPPSVRAALTPAASVESALAWTRQLACTHYENFSVISALLPRRLRQDFCNVYAFSRIADDLSDEIADASESLAQLAQLAAQVRRCHEGGAQSTLMVALRQTFARHPRLPLEPFLDLIDAFEQDRRVGRYRSFEDVADYCRRSANPVGRIVLHVCGYHDEQRSRLSDCTCTALQLANFWQDVRSDLIVRDRIYLPQDSMSHFGVTEQQLRDGRCDERFVAMMRFEVDRTAELFDRGEALLPLLEGRVRAHIRLFGAGGRAVLAAIRRCGYDTLTARPALSRMQKSALVARAGAAWIAGLVRPDGIAGDRPASSAQIPSDA
jgi:squalene synthase HpnC